MPDSYPQQVGSEQYDGGEPAFVIWIDGVGAYLVSLAGRLTVGGPALTPTPSDLSLLASLSRRHASFVRTREGYFVNAHSATRVEDKDVYDRTHLADGYHIQLGESVLLRFRLPTELSASARIEFISDHRPGHSVDGVIMMDDTFLLGPGNENHVKCPDWPGSVLVYRKGEQLWCKSRLGIQIGNTHTTDGVQLTAGDTVNGPDLRFRVESLQNKLAVADRAVNRIRGT